MHFRKSVVLLSVIVYMFLSSSAFADLKSGDFYYTASGDNITITGYAGAGGDVVIPSTINSKSVVSIGEYAFRYNTSLTSLMIPGSVTSIKGSGFQFYGCTGLTSINVDASNTAYSSQDGVLYNKAKTTLVAYPEGITGGFTIPNSVKIIGDYAFASCDYYFLTSVTIPDSVTSIGINAFFCCRGLTSVTIPGSVTSIGDLAFYSCSSLTSINVDASNTAYNSQNGVLYNKAMTELIQYPSGKSGGFFIPSSVTSIGKGAFAWSYLTSVTIPDGVTSIGDEAFYVCSYLASVTIPGSVTSIGDWAFSHCTRLTTLTIMNGVTTIGQQAFYDCTGLTSVMIPGSVTSIGIEVFEYCTGLTSINVDASNTAYSSQDGVLYNKAKTTLVAYPSGKTGGFTIPARIRSIGSHAFCGCGNLTSVTFPNSLTSLGDYAFADCSGLTSVTFPNSLTSLDGGAAFGWCENLTTVFIPKSVIYIAWDDFFIGSNNFTIYGTAGSYAQTYATTNNIPFVAVTANFIIAMTPMSDLPGKTFYESGTGGTPNGTATLHFKKPEPDGTEYPTQTLQLNNIGQFDISYTSSTNKPAGTYTWWAIDDWTGQKSNEVSYIIEGVAGELNHFAFAAIGDQTANNPFNVTVEAQDLQNNLVTTFNGKVPLWCPVPLTPSVVNVSNGIGTAQISATMPGQCLFINANYGNISGQSPKFNVSASGSSTGCIKGRVIDGNNSAVNNVTVELSRDGFVTIYDSQATGTSSNWFEFLNLPTGLYTLRARAVTDALGQEKTLIVPPGDCAMANVMLTLRQVGKRPVIFIPGIMGSNEKGGLSNLIYPDLPKETPAPASKLELHNPLNAAGWNTLKDALKNNYEVYDCPYDWRLHFGTAYGGKLPYEIYLLPLIKQAKDPNNDGQDEWASVDIVAHSMGGLLVRSYIESSDYNADIDKFAMVGTPNHGSANVYYIAEGGDPIEPDQIKPSCAVPNFYSHTVHNVYKTMRGLDLYDFSGFFCSETVKLASGMNAGNAYELIQSDVKSVKQLTATFDFLSKGGQVNPVKSKLYKNNWLENLNNPSSLNYALMRNDYCIQNAIKTFIFGANSEATITGIQVGNAEGTYLDGKPVACPVPPIAGDGTVPWSMSAVLEGITNDSSESGTHASLIGIYANKVVQFLNDGRTFTPAMGAPKRVATFTQQTPSATLGINIKGMEAPLVTEHNGLRCGIEAGTNTIYEEIAGAAFERDAEQAGFFIPDPVSDNYTLTLTGKADGVVDFTISYLDNTSSEQVEGAVFVAQNGTGTIPFIFDASGEPKIRIVAQPPAPTALSADNYTQDTSQLTQLAWDAVSAAGLAGYRVYSRLLDEPFYTLLTTVTAGQTTCQTTHPWNDPLRVYRVSAFDTLGREGLLSNQAFNKRVALADFTADTVSGTAPLTVQFTDISQGAVASRQWDFGDSGASTVQNPSHVYSTPGQYTVSLNINGEDGSDLKIKQQYITVLLPSTTTTTIASTTTTTTSIPPCTVKLTPGTISKFFSRIKPFTWVIIRDNENAAFTKDTTINWGTTGLKTLFKMALGKKTIIAMVHIYALSLDAGSTYDVTVGDCTGKFHVR